MGNNIQQHLVKKLNVGPASISLITNKVSFCQIFFFKWKSSHFDVIFWSFLLMWHSVEN